MRNKSFTLERVIRVAAVLAVIVVPMLIVSAYFNAGSDKTQKAGGVEGVASAYDALENAQPPELAQGATGQTSHDSASQPPGGQSGGQPGGSLDISVSDTQPALNKPHSAQGGDSYSQTSPDDSSGSSDYSHTEAIGLEGPGKTAYITIDDGPSRSVTPKILDVLKAEGVKATFFVLPHRNVDDLYQRIIDEGHELANHSYSHVYRNLYWSGSIDDFRDEVIMAHEFIYDNFGYTMTTFRFPGGSMSLGSSVTVPRREILSELGYLDFDWTVESGDARSGVTDRSARALSGNVLNNTRGRDQLIVLMHDAAGKRTTADALPLIIAGLRDQGYTFDVLRNYHDNGLAG